MEGLRSRQLKRRSRSQTLGEGTSWVEPQRKKEGYQVYGGRSNCFQEEPARTRAHRSSYPLDEGHTLRGTLLKWSTSTNAGYPRRDHVRSIDNVHSSLGARIKGYFSNVYGGSSNNWQEELGRTAAQRASYSFDGVRSDFERCIAKVPGRIIVPGRKAFTIDVIVAT
ncbi:hypothetical protein JHK85_023845 [Glycine max]|nr:hypothetical protein JHK85_023845 [Glycine max]